MKKIVLFLILSSFSTIVFSQQVFFENLPNIPERVSGACCAVNDGKIYLCNGWNTGSDGAELTNSIQVYNISDSSWYVLNFPDVIAKRYHNCEIINNKLYMFNGEPDNNRMEIIDLSNNSFSLGSPNPAPSRASGSATFGDNIYFFGGRISYNTYSNTLMVYDISSDSYTFLSVMPEPKETEGEIINGKLYIVGGYNGNVSNKINIYDIETDTWEDDYIMPNNGVSAHSVSKFEDKIFIIGDYNNLDYLAYFNTSDNTFNELNSNLIRRRHASSVVDNGFFYVMGGNLDDGTTTLNSFQVANLNEVLSIDDVNVFDDISLHPNPFTDYVIVNSKDFVEFEYNIYDSNLRLLKKGTSSVNENLSIKDLNAGIYFLQIQFKKGSKTFKIIRK